MAVALDVSSPASVYADTAGITSLVTASFTPPAGSIVVAKVVCANASVVAGTPTATGLTFTSRANIGTTNATCRAALFTATGAGSPITVTETFSGSADVRGLLVEVWTGAQLAASPAVHTLLTGSGAPSDSITTVAASSVVSWISADFAAINGSTRTYRTSATESSYHFLNSSYTVYLAYQAAATAGAQTYGLSAPVGQTFTMASIEIQASGAAVATRFRRIGKRR